MQMELSILGKYGACLLFNNKGERIGKDRKGRLINILETISLEVVRKRLIAILTHILQVHWEMQKKVIFSFKLSKERILPHLSLEVFTDRQCFHLIGEIQIDMSQCFRDGKISKQYKQDFNFYMSYFIPITLLIRLFLELAIT